MEVNKVYKKAVITKWEVVYYQLLSYCFFNKIQVSEADLNCMVLFCLEYDGDISGFCIKVCENEIFQTPQSVRNCLNKMVKKKLILRDKKNKKNTHMINPEMGVVYEGNILLNYNFLAVETNKS